MSRRALTFRHRVVIRKDRTRNLWDATLYWYASPTARVALASFRFLSHESALFGAWQMLTRHKRIES